MKRHKISFSILISILTLLIAGCNGESRKPVIQQEIVRTQIKLNDGWEVAFDGIHFHSINIPHTPRIEPLVVNDQWQGKLNYRRQLEVDDPTKKYKLEFEGVMHESELIINKKSVFHHVGGYLPFVVDISRYLKYDQTNVIELKVNNEDNFTIPPGKKLATLDFNFYGGIYRSVKLHIHDQVHITNSIEEAVIGGGGTLIHFDKVAQQKASGKLKVHVRNESKEPRSIVVKSVLTDEDGDPINFESKPVTVSSQEASEVNIDLEIINPKLWSVKKPHLYELKTQLFVNDVLIDEKSERVGVRAIELSPKGFYLNGEKLFIRGTNRHQEYPYVGYAISENANYRDAVKIKQAGFDFVRLSHYPQDESFLDACDELGILVMNAIPGWQYFGDSSFVKNSYQDIRDMVRRDRNHPSVVFWEVSLNESGMTSEYMYEANRILKEELPFEDTYSAGWIDHEAYDLFIPARQHGKAPDYWNQYRTDERPLFIAEYGDWEYYAHNAGFNQAAFEGLREEERTSRQLREYGEKRLLQQALNFQEAANSNMKGSNTIGDANWLMFDYNRGYAADLEASGISDIFRIPKFAYFFYQSQRSPNDTLAWPTETGPMVKIASYWQKESSPSVKVFSNCEEVSLKVNGQEVSRIRAIRDQFSNELTYPPFIFHLDQFKAGELSATGFINGQPVAFDEVRTYGKPYALELTVDLSQVPISTKESDLLFVYAKVLDDRGNLIHDSEAEISIKSSGGQIIGEHPVKAKAGIATVLLKTRPDELDLSLTASSDSLVSSTLIISNGSILDSSK
ncbi:MAG: DUF4982 domain-containing protein [Cyclobacteriaceae bacterium]